VRKNKKLDRLDDSEMNHNDLGGDIRQLVGCLTQFRGGYFFFFAVVLVDFLADAFLGVGLG
jgi:hypothetical protein